MSPNAQRVAYLPVPFEVRHNYNVPGLADPGRVQCITATFYGLQSHGRRTPNLIQLHWISDACVSYDFVSGPEPIRALTSATERGLAGEAAFGPYWLDAEMRRGRAQWHGCWPWEFDGRRA